MKRLATAFLAIALGAVPLLAQHHTAAPANVVDGAKNPELIPDSIAYLHVFLNLSAPTNATVEERRIQLSHLTILGLDQRDSQAALVVLAEFRSQRDAWVARWNAEAQTTGASFSPGVYLKQEEDMLQATRDALKRSLSATGMLKFDSFAQTFKKSIVLHTGGGQ